MASGTADRRCVRGRWFIVTSTKQFEPNGKRLERAMVRITNKSMKGTANRRVTRGRRCSSMFTSSGLRHSRHVLSVAVALAAALVLPATSQASWEGVGEFGAETLAEAPGGMAVNDTTGDVYEADGPRSRVLRFDAKGNFLEAWGWGVGDGANKFERCGPDGEPSYPTCEGSGEGHGVSGEGEGQFAGTTGVAVDQANGDVVVVDANSDASVQIFTADGSKRMAGFAEAGTAEGQVGTITPYGPGVAVDSECNVYIIDQGVAFGPRVMEFKPQTAGKCENFTFSRSLFKGTRSQFASMLDVDNAGNIYLGKERAIYKFAASDLTKPACEEAAITTVEGMAINPVTGGIYFYDTKLGEVFELSPTCTESKKFKGGTSQENAPGAAFNPTGVWSAGRPEGVLYLDTALGLSKSHTQKVYVFAQTANPELPKLGEVAATSVGAAFATLEAEVNPLGSDTHVKFEYGAEGPCSSHLCVVVPEGVLDIGSGKELQRTSVQLAGLTPDTKYYFRVTATNGFGTATGSDEPPFQTFPMEASGLPDGRVYELVSPIGKDGGEAFPLDPNEAICGCEPGIINPYMPMQSAETAGGEPLVVYEGYPFSPGGGAVGENEYRATRTAAGWQTEGLSPPLLGREAGGFRGFTPDLSVGVLAQGEPALSPQAIPGGYQDLYRRDSDGTLTPLMSVAPPHRTAHEPGAFAVEYVGESSDDKRIFFTANDALTGKTAVAPAALDGGASENNLYEWENGTVRLVNVLPGNVKTIPDSAFGSGKELESNQESAPVVTNAISRDGSHVFWSNTATGQVYVRIDGESTKIIPDSGRFLTASTDGQKVLFSDGHIYNLEAKSDTDITSGNGGFVGTLGTSEDLARIYFVDTGVLTTQKNGFGAGAQPNANNLYTYDSATRTVEYIATLAIDDNHTGGDHLVGDWEPSPSDRIAQVTGDGRFVAFESRAPLTGYDNEGLGGECEIVSFATCFEVFEYDSSAKSLTCVSCSPALVQPLGSSSLSLLRPVGSRFPQPRNLQNDGRVYFNSFDVLSPHDTEPGVENVYEYERAGQGSCTAEAGCVALISSGHSAFGAEFFSATGSGRDVFFTTRAQLVPEDGDELVDLYDSREGGGFATVLSPAPCSGEGCSPMSELAPEWTTLPGSMSIGGAPWAGLSSLPAVEAKAAHVAAKPKLKPAAARRCPKHRLRRHGRCVKVKAKRTQKARKNASHHSGIVKGGV
jgi:DNA-binding beta-propeller fold protein YncE